MELVMPDHMRISYAQNGEDVRVWRALRHVQHGFYVEVGASHPYDHSLSAALSAEGWSGVLVEPEPAAADLLRRERPGDVVVAAAASAKSGLLSWENLGERGEGRIAATGRGLTVPAVRVGDVLVDVAPEDVHFMSVDVEGHEHDALLGADLERWQPWILCVEATAPLTRTQTHEAWEHIILGAGYRYVTFDGLNRWYVSPAHDELLEPLGEPFGVLDVMLDGWRRHDSVILEGRLHEAVAEVDRLRDEHRREVEHLHRLQGELQAEQARVAQLESAIRDLQELTREARRGREQLADELHAAALEARRREEQLEHELQSVVAERDAALVRERVLLTSKSWRLTRPLRNARVTGASALRSRRGQDAAGHATTAPPAAAVETPALARRRLALAAKVQFARRRAGR
jgi:FkbM family methyltransferase